MPGTVLGALQNAVMFIITVIPTSYLRTRRHGEGE